MSGYDRALRLKHLRLRGWQRETFSWGAFVLAVLLSLTGRVSPWGILLIPLAVAGLVKLHDLLVGRLRTFTAGPATAPRSVAPGVPETTNPRSS